uniref:Ig-like domain-containing protein n=1 Tax=Ornithorhynchus anatinus TaxID=9258 RepID=A0A6I8PG36_ORNAN
MAPGGLPAVLPLLGFLLLRGRACPAACRCYSTTVECGSLGLRDVPAGIQPSTQTAFLQDNGIRRIERRDLERLPALRYLYVQNNSISALEPGAFRGQRRLLELALDANRIHLVDGGVFKGLDRLRVLYLAGNRITRLPDFTFRHLRRLQELHLEKNGIEMVEEQAMAGLTSLALLDLSKNHLRTISRAALRPLASLQVLRLAENPWRCDCALHWLSGWIREEGRRLLGPLDEKMVCAEPPRLARRSLLDVSANSLICIPPWCRWSRRRRPPARGRPEVSCRASGYPQPLVTWRKVAAPSRAGEPGPSARPASRAPGPGGRGAGERVDSDTGSGMLSLTNVTVAHAGRYECEASNPGGAARVPFLLLVDLSRQRPPGPLPASAAGGRGGPYQAGSLDFAPWAGRPDGRGRGHLPAGAHRPAAGGRDLPQAPQAERGPEGGERALRQRLLGRPHHLRPAGGVPGRAGPRDVRHRPRQAPLRRPRGRRGGPRRPLPGPGPAAGPGRGGGGRPALPHPGAPLPAADRLRDPLLRRRGPRAEARPLPRRPPPRPVSPVFRFPAGIAGGAAETGRSRRPGASPRGPGGPRGRGPGSLPVRRGAATSPGRASAVRPRRRGTGGPPGIASPDPLGGASAGNAASGGGRPPGRSAGTPSCRTRPRISAAPRPTTEGRLRAFAFSASPDCSRGIGKTVPRRVVAGSAGPSPCTRFPSAEPSGRRARRARPRSPGRGWGGPGFFHSSRSPGPAPQMKRPRHRPPSLLSPERGRDRAPSRLPTPPVGPAAPSSACPAEGRRARATRSGGEGRVLGPRGGGSSG